MITHYPIDNDNVIQRFFMREFYSASDNNLGTAIHHHQEVIVVDEDQLWFWSDAWQEGEDRVDNYISEGNIREFESAEELLESLPEQRCMIFQYTPQFVDDFSNLEKRHKRYFKEELENIEKALEGDTQLYSRHRVQKMKGHDYICEAHVRGDNLCITFHYSKNNKGDKVCFLRRIGNHSIYNTP